MENGSKIEQGSKLETQGIDYIPEAERNSNPWNVFFVLCGTPLSFGVMVLGSLPIIFGLGWWDSVLAITVGTLLGSLLIAPMGLLGQKTGTNGPVSSGAHFGVRGKSIGAILTVFTSLGFFSLTIWTGAQTLIYGGHKLFGLPEGDGVLTIGALLIGIFISVVATFGHSFVVMIEKIGVIVIGVILLLSFIVFLPQFDASLKGGEYLLGGYWPTWFLAVTVAISIPVSCSTYINDYTRYISNKTSARSVVLGTFGGMFIGCWLCMIAAAYLTTMLTSLETPFVQGIIEIAPSWLIWGFILIGIFGSLTQGCFALYGAGLGLETLGFGGNRIISTISFSIIGFLLVLLIIFVYDITNLINAFVVALTVGISPWLTINLVGLSLFKAQYSPLELHQNKESRYWYSNGFNKPAITSWIVAVIIGLLFTATSFFSGPFVNLVGGVDVSFVSSAVVGAALYYLLVKKTISKENKTGEAEQTVGEII
ncbi:nitrate reductase [Peribacillus cavernae]|uniref:Nitrate reductase n=1 Tax=Peribacillus cavernae TaxID=1674310 RepID=A0A433HPC8_9BACI|nr:cytosine permease [Peribacillus cavernae]MDQ0217408.1 purine-cytosine permease-like protein [Peribacillus cavernae]RUQ30144.1 nitrate reductase [Peribacillus cavernae]